MSNVEKIVRTLSLANNGYTYARNLTAEQCADADAAVKAGLARKVVDISNRQYDKDDRTFYTVV